MTHSIDHICKDAETLALRIDEANIKAGIKQMLDMCEWLEMETSVEFDWRKWVSSYEECPVDDHHLLTGNHKALFVQMINLCPDFDACVQAWKDYSELYFSSLWICVLSIQSVEPNRNIYLSGWKDEKKVTVVLAPNNHTRIRTAITFDQLMDLTDGDKEFDGMAVWVDGELDFMYGYPNLGPNGHMVAIETPTI